MLRKKYRVLLTLLLLTATNCLYAQKGYSLTCGIGKYELTNIGVQRNFAKISSLSAYVGTNFGIQDKKLFSGGISFDQVFKKPSNWFIKPGYSVGAVYWSQDDEFYFFESITFPVMALIAYPITSTLTARVEGGGVYSAVITSDRKQNTTAGYPKRFDANVRFNLIYKFKHDEK